MARSKKPIMVEAEVNPQNEPAVYVALYRQTEGCWFVENKVYDNPNQISQDLEIYKPRDVLIAKIKVPRGKEAHNVYKI